MDGLKGTAAYSEIKAISDALDAFDAVSEAIERSYELPHDIKIELIEYWKNTWATLLDLVKEGIPEVEWPHATLRMQGWFPVLQKLIQNTLIMLGLMQSAHI